MDDTEELAKTRELYINVIHHHLTHTIAGLKFVMTLAEESKDPAARLYVAEVKGILKKVMETNW